MRRNVQCAMLGMKTEVLHGFSFAVFVLGFPKALTFSNDSIAHLHRGATPGLPFYEQPKVVLPLTLVLTRLRVAQKTTNLNRWSTEDFLWLLNADGVLEMPGA